VHHLHQRRVAVDGGDKAAEGLAKAEEERAACAADGAEERAACAADGAEACQSANIHVYHFLLLWKILGVEYAGKEVAVLPFEPFGLLQRLTLRGLKISEELLDLPKTAVADAASPAVMKWPTRAYDGSSRMLPLDDPFTILLQQRLDLLHQSSL